MRVMFTSVAAWGHVHPMVPLARAFMARGDDIVWATGADACTRLERDGIPTTPAGISEPEFKPRAREYVARFEHLPPEERPRHMFGKIFGELSASTSIEAIEAAMDAFGPDLVISEQGEFSGPLAATVRDIPHVCHAFGPRLPIDRVERVEAEVAPLWEQRGLAVRPLGACYDHLYLDIYPPSLAGAAAPLSCDVQSVRPEGFATAGEQLPDFVMQPDDRPLVYVTLGTVFNPTGALADAVEAIRGLDVRVVATVGPSGDPAALGDQPDNVHVAKYISQNDLLPHCSAVVSHAGSGTFLAAAAAGLPQVCLPQGADQFLNASAGATAGAALMLHPADATVETIRAAGERVLGELEFAVAAGRVAADIAAMPGTDEVADLLADRFA